MLSKLENDMSIPTLVSVTFIEDLTREKLTVAAELLSGLVLGLIAIGLSLLCVRFCSRPPMRGASSPTACAFPISASWETLWIPTSCLTIPAVVMLFECL